MIAPSSNWRFIAVGILLVVLIVSATSLIIRSQRDASIDAYRTATNNLGVGMARQTAHSLGLIDQTLRQMSDTLRERTPSAGPAGDVSAAMRRIVTPSDLLERRSKFTSVEAFALIGPNGGTISEAGQTPLQADDVSIREGLTYFSTHDGTTAFVSEPVRSATNGEWTATLARRVDLIDGSFAGIVVAVLSLRELQDFYEVAMPKNRSVYLTRRDGLVLVRFPAAAKAAGAKVPELPQWTAVVVKGGGTFVSDGGSQEPAFVASVIPLPDLPFVVEATVLESFALVDWYRQTAWTVAGGVAIGAGLLALLKIFANQYRRIERSKQVLAEQNTKLDISRERLQATLASISLGVCFFSGDRKLILANDRYAAMYGLKPQAVYPGMPLEAIVEARRAVGSAPRLPEESSITLIDRISRATASEFVIDLQNDRTILIRHQPMPEGGWVSTHEDITERRAAEAKIAFLATHDVLTGLANRSLLEERIERAQRAAEEGRPFAVLFLDLDGFKAVNSTLGHRGGDELLHAVAKRLVACVREGDTVARTGGDEFVILLQNKSTDADAEQLAVRIIEKLAQPFQIDGAEVSVGTSIGIAVAPRDGATVDGLVKCADMALYVAKAEGRGRFRFFEAEFDVGEKMSA